MSLPNNAESIDATIQTEIRPLIIKDGGDIEFISFVDGIVSIKLSGACVSCPYSLFTIKLGILDRLSEKFPEVCDVRAV